MSAAGPLPLVVGITGHRDLRDQDHDALASSVRALFADLRRRYEATPLVLLSPLAEGADRLAARVALEEGVRLVVPLPLPPPLYEADFGAPGSLDEFRSLLARAETHFEVPLPEGGPAGDV